MNMHRLNCFLQNFRQAFETFFVTDQMLAITRLYDFACFPHIARKDRKPFYFADALPLIAIEGVCKKAFE